MNMDVSPNSLVDKIKKKTYKNARKKESSTIQPESDGIQAFRCYFNSKITKVK